MPADLGLLKKRNENRWASCQINASRLSLVKSVANRLSVETARNRYLEVQKATGVPWMVVAVIHERESTQRWDRSLAQGDPWNRVSTHVPKGRGPFPSWQAAAIDALVICPPYAARWKDWSIGGTLTLLEQYNGLGYANKGIPSPYIWASTNQYVKGKYVADGVFDPNHVDQQLGCAALLKFMGYLETPVGESLPPPPPPLTPKPPATEPRPSPKAETPTFMQSVVNFLRSIFWRG